VSAGRRYGDPEIERLERQMQACEAYDQPDLTYEDRVWLRRHFELAGVELPSGLDFVNYRRRLA